MTPSSGKIHPAPLLAALLVSACATTPPPLAELAEAEAEIDRARRAEAAELAPVELRFAQDKLARARAASEGRDYKSAAALAAEAMVDAELAAAKSAEARARRAVQEKVDDNARLRRELLGEGGRP